MVTPIDTQPQPQPPTYDNRVLRDMEFERKRTEDEKFTFWAVIWTLIGFKIGTIAIIWYLAKGSAEAQGYIASTSWYWLIVPVVAASGGIAYRWRLYKARKRAAQLQKSEHIEDYWADRHEHHELTDEEKARLQAIRRTEHLEHHGSSTDGADTAG